MTYWLHIVVHQTNDSNAFLGLVILRERLRRYLNISPGRCSDKLSITSQIHITNTQWACLVDKLDGRGQSYQISSLGNSATYKAAWFTKNDILSNSSSVLSSFDLSTQDYCCEIPLLYCIHKLHKYPFKHRFTAGSADISPNTSQTNWL